ncbi:MAG: MarR family transcriptional regulator [Anaerolineales bacterium]|jgi:DNA-binding MarR family transcriptional regulator|uniref:MarR family winged helix-turn-helix transcriptional regulator n=1 Tax=Candidatus Villigracilis affinis TaxID=3140682 RepID=UPI001B492420|nr:MarR family transcriptional regulator [Anaerolineales bacterium]MBK9604602.1 MarR family transcriptional regulator [Anaerolineales bacterium]MBL0348499.1 MarR family transcriptional regulator [Anaerolineales bacterium]MBP8047178.1 MarR family transcriptional regulator [Anaerolineales bacterium]
MTKPVQINQSLRAWMDVFMHRSMRGWNQFAKSTGLSMPQFSILMQLHYKGVCGLSEISERFDVSAAAASQLAEKLVQSGYLERAEDPSDRRAKLLRLSSSGEKLVSEGIQERYRWMDEVTSKLSTEDSAKVAEALNILTNAAREMDTRKGNT